MTSRARRRRSAGKAGAYPHMTRKGLRYQVKGPVRMPDGTIKRIDRRRGYNGETWTTEQAAPGSAYDDLQRVRPGEVKGPPHVVGIETTHDHRRPMVGQRVEAAARRIEALVGGASTAPPSDRPNSARTSGACRSYYNEYANRYDKRLARPVSVRHALLALLSEGPKYGLRLQQEFEERTGEVWPLNVGQVYITLQRLERDGLVESDDEREAGPQKRYVITPAGGAELDGWLHTPADDIPPPRDELVIKVLISLRVPGADVHDIVQVHRRHMVELMQRYWRLKAGAAEDDIGLALVADAEMFRLDGIVRWLDAADARLKSYPAPDPAGRLTAAGVPTQPVQKTGKKVPR